MANKQKFDAYQEVTDAIVSALESGVAPWRRRWAGASFPLRHNGVAYQGINVLLLWAAAQKHGYASPYWMTFRQAQAFGAFVRKGEKSTMIVKYGVIEREKDGGEDPDRIPYLRAYRVFNADQIAGLDAAFHPEASRDTGARPLPELAAFFSATGARIETRGCQPCYRPLFDRIEMPAIESFETAQDYYATLAHELVHWTGHKTRLDRLDDPQAGKTAYAFEELIAEIGACFLSTEIGMAPRIEESAAYVESWLKALRNDKRFIFRASSAAQRASVFAVKAAGRTPAAEAKPMEDQREAA